MCSDLLDGPSVHPNATEAWHNILFRSHGFEGGAFGEILLSSEGTLREAEARWHLVSRRNLRTASESRKVPSLDTIFLPRNRFSISAIAADLDLSSDTERIRDCD